MKLAILHHDSYKADQAPHYFISGLAAQWKKNGIEVLHISGTRNLPEADAAFLHVDLSVVPRRFAEAARRYPVVVNLGILDIRKRSLPGLDHHVRAPKNYEGEVILKTNLNHNAEPERRAFRRAGESRLPFVERWKLRRIGRRSKCDLVYKIYPTPAMVSGRVWKNPDYVVEKFLPEREGNFYVLRNAYFLNEASECWKLTAAKPVVRWRDLLHEEPCPLPPEVEAYRRSIRLDYGKIDFVLHEGKPFIFDANKTIGGPALPEEAISARMAGGFISLLAASR